MIYVCIVTEWQLYLHARGASTFEGRVSVRGEKNVFKILSISLLEEFQGHICVEKKYIPEKRISILFTFFLHYLIHPWKQKIIFHRSVGNRAHA